MSTRQLAKLNLRMIGKSISFIMSLSILLYFQSAVITLQAKPQRKGGDITDNNGDGKISKDEFDGPEKAFNAMDADGVGYASNEERQNIKQKRRATNANIENNEGQNYPDLIIKKYDKERAWPGNIIFADSSRKCVVEATLEGKIVWQYSLPNARHLGDVELLPNDNVLVLSGGDGVYEISRDHKVVWSYNNTLADHDTDRLKNGNTLIASTGSEKASEFPYTDPQVFEVNPKGEIVWKWYAKTEYANSKYKDIRSQDGNDWVHVNSVQRLDDGLTLISMRNWNLFIAVDDKGITKWITGDKEKADKERGRKSPHCPHTVVQLDNGNIIVSEPVKGRVIEWDPKQEKVVWSYPDIEQESEEQHYFIRAAHRLPNGNTFIIDSNGQFFEVTSNKEIVWHAQLVDYKPPTARGKPSPTTPCFNADRRGLPFFGGR